VRVLVTGGSGVLGRAAIPRLRTLGHEVSAPPHGELDVLDRDVLQAAVTSADAVYHLATRIPQGGGDWAANDRVRQEGTRLLVDAALGSKVAVFVLPTVVFVYPPGPADEGTPVVPHEHLRSALAAEEEVARFAAAGRRGVVLRLGRLWGPGTDADRPTGDLPQLHVDDAGAALAAALVVPSGLYNVVADGHAVSNRRFKAASGWMPVR